MIWTSRVSSSILVSRWGKLRPDVIVVHYPDCSPLRESLGPSDVLVLKATIEDEELAALLQCCPRLDELPDVSLASTMIVASVSVDIVILRSPGKNSLVVPEILVFVSLQRHLADNEKLRCDLPLQLGVVARIAVRERRSDHSDRPPTRSDCRLMHGRVHARGETRNHGEAILHELAHELACALEPVRRGLRVPTTATDREFTRSHQPW